MTRQQRQRATGAVHKARIAAMPVQNLLTEAAGAQACSAANGADRTVDCRSRDCGLGRVIVGRVIAGQCRC